MADELTADVDEIAGSGQAQSIPGWRELWLKEDWWAIWLDLGLVLVSCLLYAQGGEP